MSAEEPLADIAALPGPARNAARSRVGATAARRGEVHCAALIAAIGTGIAGLVVGGSIVEAWPAPPYLLMILPLVGPVAVLAYWLRENALDQRALTLVAARGDVTDVGRLLEALPFAERRTRALGVAAVRRLAPALTRELASGLTARQRYALHTLLFFGTPDDAISLLGVLSNVGDAGALPYIDGLARGHGIPRRWRERAAAIRRTARQAADAITAREVLLRAGYRGSERTEELMRPADGTRTDPHELVRAEAAPNDGTSR